jgi:uncharacterized protein (TIGR03083 family)
MSETNDTAGDPVDDPIDDLAADPRAAEVLALSATARPPADLRGRVLAAATAARPGGFPDGPAEHISPGEAFRRTLLDARALVADLTDDEATRGTIEGWTVAGLLGHLIAIEEHFGSTLGWWPAGAPVVDEHDHLAMTLPQVHRAQERPFADVRDRWNEVVDRVLDHLASLDDRQTERVMFNGFDFSIRSLLIARTFEVWTHSEDICRAVGRSPATPDPSRLRLMTGAAVGALPLGMLITGREPRGRTVRMVLTGDGGGTWVQALELDTAPGPDVDTTLVADAVEFCRVAAKRRSPDQLVRTVVGDDELAADVLGAVAIFAA